MCTCKRPQPTGTHLEGLGVCCRYPAHEPLQGICLVRRRLRILRSLHRQRRLQQGAGCLGFPAVLRMQAAKQNARTTLCCGQHSFTTQQPTCVFSTMASRTVDSSACAGAQAHLPSRCGPYASASFASCRPKPTYGCLTLLHDIATRTCPVHTLQCPTLPFPIPTIPTTQMVCVVQQSQEKHGCRRRAPA